MNNAFNIKNPIVKIDTKSLEREATNARTQSGVVNKKRKEGVQMAMVDERSLAPKPFYYFSKAGVK
jgi:hypothetical protein